VVLLDYQMPEMDGIGFLRELRGDVAVAGTLCVVLSSMGERVAQADALGVSAWLTKPVRRAQLQSMLATIAGRSPRAPIALRAIATDVRYTGARVLLVEDNRVNQDVARRVLESFGIEAQLVADGSEAVAQIRRSVFDLVLMDCQMPVLDGYEATRLVRSWEKEVADGRRPRLPIVAMTANALHGDREKCLAAGMDDYLPKPIKREAIAAALAKWLPTSEVLMTGRAPEDGAKREILRSAEVPSSAGALDLAVTQQLADLMGEGLSDVIETYLSDTPAQFAAMEAAIEQRNYDVLGRCAHSVKSSSQSVGTTTLARAAEALELLADAQGSLAEAERMLAAMRAALGAAEPQLRAVVETGAPQSPDSPRSNSPEPQFVKQAASRD
jgi:CheY-like chemotaxis protein/HPt (histidine-containing phosphotransfer) domain-containing protein